MALQGNIRSAETISYINRFFLYAKSTKKQKQDVGDVGLTETKRERLDRIKQEEKERKLWREGKLVHRTEPELKTHTSYLTFAILPQESEQHR